MPPCAFFESTPSEGSWSAYYEPLTEGSWPASLAFGNCTFDK